MHLVSHASRRLAAFASCLAIAGAVHAAAPMAKISAPGFYRIMVGDIEVTAISDGTVQLPVDKLLQEPAADTKRALAQSFLSTPVDTSVTAYVVNTGAKLVMIDAGAGKLFGPTLGKVAANLKAAGYQPEQVDEIYITHLHPDHVGGLAPGGTPAFPNAVVRADRRDTEFWLSQANLDKAPADNKPFFQGAMGSLQPYASAQRLRTFDGDNELVPGVRASSSYGHTPGHTTYVVESKGQKLLLVGDLIHVGAVQFAKPGVTIAFDTDQKAAAAARRATFTQAAKKGDMIGASHLPFPGLGHLRSAGQGFQWVPLNYAELP
ncbi:MBL fold metallo-hydrolase [Noviherbaspirillum galbum]|uniref:MBL fold metallo-hydrolase n=1 Tax=Noviherbaspirillum galbum TaxID=2709383 RepID=A0A6B3SUX5_9BURK|nr:MBL fold metallo-hydrolase [Noviherbaspirillum galbum]NEX62172.1 MBL fold metallo-hydrolase [Noviherbaspirillum galbum]